MVKNLPSVERSTKIRFGKHVPDSNDQEENTIVFNASNVTVPTPYSNAVYLSPIRNRSDFSAPEVVLLMYDRNTKEITESGESANALVGGVTFTLAVDRANVTSNTIQFTGGGHDDNNVAFVTDSNVGISNLLPQHTVSVGSNLYIDEFGSNVLVVSGNVAVLRDMVIDGNLRVNGDTTVIYAENTAIKDAFIELGQNNTSEDTTLDLGVLMHRPDALSNVVIGYREGSDEFAIGYTDAKPTDKIFTPKTDEDINVHVYGLTHVDANIYAHEDLVVDGNVYVSQNVSVTEELTVSGNVYADKDLEVVGNTYVDGNVVASQDFTLSGNAYVSGNIVASQDLTLSGNTYISGNIVASQDLTLSGNAYVSGNVVASQDLLVTGNVYVSTNVDVTQELTVSGNVYADKDLEVVGNVFVDGNVVAYQDVLVTGNVYVSTNVSVTKELTVTGNVYADKDLEVVGNTYVSGNVEVTKDLIVTGNTHLEGPNVFITHTMDFLDPTTAIVTDQVSNVQIRLGQLENVANTVSNPLEDHVIVYDGTEWVNDYPMHTYIKIRNDEDSATIEKGDAVYVKGTHNSNILNVGLAHSDSTDTMPCIGLSNQQLTTGQQGTAVAYGKALSVVTTGFIAGETVYVSNTVPGGLSNVKPFNNDLIQNVGVVTKVHGSNGGVFVTGIGRANDIPNASLITDYNDMNYVYVNNINNDLKKIASENLNIPLTTAVSSSSNSAANAVTLRGVSITSGDGFHGDLVVAGNVTVDTNTLKVDAEANRVGILTVSPGYPLDVRGAANVGTFRTTTGTVTDGTHSTSKDTGVLVLTQGGLGVEANIHSTNVFATSHIAVGTSATSNTFDVRGTANVGALVTTSTHISDSTAVTSKTTGALQVTGGVGIQGDLYAADTTLDSVKALNLATGTLPFTDSTKKLVDSVITQNDDGSIIISANVEIAGNVSVVGNTFALTSNDVVITDRIFDIANNNTSTSLDIGILMEHPGKNIFIGHHTNPQDNFTIGYTSNGCTEDHVEWNGTDHITANVWGYLITQNTVTIEHNDLYVKNGLIGVTTESPVANIHVVGNAFVTSNITTSSNVLITGDAAATSKTTGALQVAGGVGVAGDIHATHANLEDVEADSVNITDTTASTSKTTGALQVAGGVGVQGDIYGVTVYTDDYLTHIDDTNTKIGFPANDTFTITTNNGERIRVNSSGSVGIGTASPIAGSNLHVFGQTTTISSDTTGSSAGPEVTLYRDQTGSNGNYLGQIRYEGQNDNSGDKLYGKITGKIKSATQGSEDGVIETALITGGSQRISVRHSGDLFQIKNGTDFEVGEVANLYVDTATNSVGINTDSPAYNLDVRGTSNVGVFTTPDASVTDATTSSSKTTGALKVAGGVGIVGPLFGANANLEDVEADSVNVTDTTAATNKTTGALKVAGGVGVSGALYGANANLEDVEADSVNVTDTTAATNKTTGALKVAGGVGVSGALHAAAATFDDLTVDGTTLTVDTGNNRVGIGMNNPGYALDVTGDFNVSGNIRIGGVPFSSSQWTTTGSDIYYTTGNVGIGEASPSAPLHVAGGTIINSDGVAKKTYSYTGDLGAGQTVANSTIKITFSNHVFYAKIVAHLVESDDEVSTLSLECGGGNWSAGTPLAIAKGPQAIFGSTSTNPWSSTVTTSATTVSIKPTTNMAVAGHYNVFIEYISQHSSGVVSKITEGATDVVTFGY
ncbi:tail fiber protein [Ostreococcus lucimarinus virus 2]|uniref:tail fiber protein n=1 Tax=Ostreococcus lucimarinus virus 2 TaxID=1663208 RepID=UPI0006D0E93E|nr:tail fiber protein [Ostreococcus lucimarinus virus 2]ALI95431.1 hypothetical protein OlV2_068 [Ostreococcus lucimarinus virus 2]